MASLPLMQLSSLRKKRPDEGGKMLSLHSLSIRSQRPLIIGIIHQKKEQYILYILHKNIVKTMLLTILPGGKIERR
jgi:hypothetical protein